MKWVSRAALVALYTLGLLTAGVAVSDANAQTPLKLAFLYSDQVLSQHPGYNAANVTYSQAASAAQARQQTMQDSIQGAIAAYQKDRPILNDSIRGLREDGLNALSQRFQQENTDIQDHLDALNDSLMAPMREQIVAVIEAVRNEDGYAFVFDIANTPGIVAMDKNLDITAKVAARVRALPAPRPAATTPPPAATPGRGGAAAPPAAGRGGTTPPGNGATGASPAGAGRAGRGGGP